MTEQTVSVAFIHDTVDNACIQFSDAPGVGHGGAAFVGGFVPSAADQMQPLRQTRDRRPVDAFVEDAKYDFRMEGSYLYGGLIYGHFGHIMSEMIHRVLTTRRHFRERPWIFVGLHNSTPILGYHHLPGSFKAALDFLNVAKENVLCLHAHAQVERLSITEQGSDFGGGPKPGYLELLKAHSECRLDAMFPTGSPHRLLYVSRSNLPHGGSFLGERYLEKHLVAEGYEVFHPEDHALAWQMEVYRRAEIVIFPEGSACHGTELLGDRMLGTCVFLERRSSHRRVFHNVLAPRARNFIALEGFPQLGSASRHPITGELSEHAAVWAYDTERLVASLRQHGIAHLPQFSKVEYLEQCRQDLEEYLARFLNPPMSAMDEDVFRSIYSALDRLY